MRTSVRSASTIDELRIEPPIDQWAGLARGAADQQLLGRPLRDWHRDVRSALGLPDGPIIATGHQTLLWHPGILVKYVAVEAVLERAGGELAGANLIVDQHADGFGTFPAPVLDHNDALAVRDLRLTDERPGVPMGLHPPFTPRPPRGDWRPALPSVRAGVDAIYAAVAAHGGASNAALQMAGALIDLMSPWVRPLPSATASALLASALGRRLLEEMIADPWRCATAYNDAVAAVPEAGMEPLLIRDDIVELPLWRIGEDRRRYRAFDGDAQTYIEDGAPTLLPRALLLTALVRLVMCDLFVHGTGGARYDQAMERWVRTWLGVDPAPKAIATATMRLPLGNANDDLPDPAAAQARLRRTWHDPEPTDDHPPGPRKRELLDEITSAPRNSPQRLRRFREMHELLDELRSPRRADLEALRTGVAEAYRRATERPIIDRRTWPFPLYEQEAIDALAEQVRAPESPRKAP